MREGSTVLLLNPTACKGKAGERRGEIETALTARGLAYETVLTEAPGHAVELARQACAAGCLRLIAAGGDGTMNEIINGLMAGKAASGRAPVLGIIPVGRGNDFAYGVGLPSGLAEATAIAATGIEGPLDIGFVRGGDYPEGRHFGNGLGVGFDARVGFAASRMKRIRGSFAYTLGAIQLFAAFPAATQVRIEAGSFSHQGKCHQVSMMNGRRMGGSYYMAPEAVIDDGLLDLCVVEEVNRREMADLIMRYTKGTQKGRPKVTMLKASVIELAAPEGGLAVHADGETICEDGRSIRVECMPAALRVLRGPAGATGAAG